MDYGSAELKRTFDDHFDTVDEAEVASKDSIYSITCTFLCYGGC